MADTTCVCEGGAAFPRAHFLVAAGATFGGSGAWAEGADPPAPAPCFAETLASVGGGGAARHGARLLTGTVLAADATRLCKSGAAFPLAHFLGQPATEHGFVPTPNVPPCFPHGAAVDRAGFVVVCVAELSFVLVFVRASIHYAHFLFLNHPPSFPRLPTLLWPRRTACFRGEA